MKVVNFIQNSPLAIYHKYQVVLIAYQNHHSKIVDLFPIEIRIRLNYWNVELLRLGISF